MLYRAPASGTLLSLVLQVTGSVPFELKDIKVVDDQGRDIGMPELRLSMPNFPGAGLAPTQSSPQVSQASTFIVSDNQTAEKAISSQTVFIAGVQRNLSTTMGHSTGLIREQCPVW